MEYLYELKVKFNRYLISLKEKEEYFNISGKYISNCIDGIKTKDLINKRISTFMISSLDSNLNLNAFKKDIEISLNGKSEDFEIISLDNFIFKR